MEAIFFLCRYIENLVLALLKMQLENSVSTIPNENAHVDSVKTHVDNNKIEPKGLLLNRRNDKVREMIRYRRRRQQRDFWPAYKLHCHSIVGCESPVGLPCFVSRMETPRKIRKCYWNYHSGNAQLQPVQNKRILSNKTGSPVKNGQFLAQLLHFKQATVVNCNRKQK